MTADMTTLENTAESSSWDDVVDGALTDALYSLGLIQHFEDDNDRFAGLDHPAGGGIDVLDVLAEFRRTLTAAMRAGRYEIVNGPLTQAFPSVAVDALHGAQDARGPRTG